MAKLPYSHRILADTDFIGLLEGNTKTILHLTNTKASSLHHTGTHTVILQEDFDQAVKDGKLTEGQIKAAFKRVECPEFLEDEDDLISKRVRFAIHLSSKQPFQTMILTTSEKEKEYRKNPHFSGITSVSVRSNDDALEFINTFFQEFCERKEKERDQQMR